MPLTGEKRLQYDWAKRLTLMQLKANHPEEFEALMRENRREAERLGKKGKKLPTFTESL